MSHPGTTSRTLTLVTCQRIGYCGGCGLLARAKVKLGADVILTPRGQTPDGLPVYVFCRSCLGLKPE